MNLVHDRWIPVLRASGKRERVAPWQLAEAEDPLLELASPRPDFDGALAQLWIGLLQTAFAPEDARTWRERFRQPPAPEVLRAAFEPIAHAFELLGDGPRFLQDLKLAVAGEPERIERLLIESPGDNTVKEGKAHFVKGGEVEMLCAACAAAMLATLQTNAPSGGQGHRTGLRGGGPLTTLVWTSESLWQALWLNVLPRARFEGLAGNTELTRPEHTFPWLAPTRTSEKGSGKDTTAEDVFPAQMFFGMPRRLRLAAETRSPAPACDLCGESAEPAVTGYVAQNLGVNYTGSWCHPLTPYRKDKSGILLSIKGDHAAVSYRSYLGLVQNDDELGLAPAEVVRRACDLERMGIVLKLWAFGFEMDNMKARAWCEGTMPLWQLPPETRPRFEAEVARRVRAARQVAADLTFAVKLLYARRPKDVKGSLEGVTLRFWQATEPAFYETLAKLETRVTEQVEAGIEGSAALAPEKEAWRRVLADAAQDIFNLVAQAGHFEGSDPRRVAEAWQVLSFRVGPHNKKLREVLGLPALEASPKRAKTRGKAAA